MTVFQVSTEADLAAAIDQVNVAPPGTDTIDLLNDIALATKLPGLTPPHGVEVDITGAALTDAGAQPGIFTLAFNQGPGIGVGIVYLDNDNRYTGGTIVDGELVIGDGSPNETAGSIVGDVEIASSLTFANRQATTYAGILSGDGELGVAQQTFVTLTGTNTFTGTVDIAGVLQLGAGGTTGSIASNSIVIDGGILQLDHAGSENLTQTISGFGGSIEDIGTGNLTLSGHNAYGGNTTANGAVIELAYADSAGGSAIGIRDGQTLMLDAGQCSAALAWAIGGTVDLRGVGLATDIVRSTTSTQITVTTPNGPIYLGSASDLGYVGHFDIASDGAGGSDITLVADPISAANPLYLNGDTGQFTITPTGDGALEIQQGDGAIQTLPAGVSAYFTNGQVVADPTGAIGDVARLYQAAFDRVPDADGIDYWSAQVAHGAIPLAAVAGAFTGTPEFIADYNGLDDGGFVAKLYQDVLHRPGDAGGEGYWRSLLGDGASRASVLASFAASDENRADTRAIAGDADDAEAYRLYRAAFGRAPDASGQAYWSDRIAATGAAQIAAGFTRTPEFMSDYAATSNADYVRALYVNVLGRAGDGGGDDYWVAQLAAGASRAQILQGFADSPENRGATASATHDGYVLIPAASHH